MNPESPQVWKANRFLELHAGPELLVLPNAWDVSSARVFELEDFCAVATTSAGIAATLGYPDGERMSLAENLDVVRRIAASTALPVTADIEAGYAKSVEGVAKAARAVLDAGAVGLNIEDGTDDPSNPLCDRLLQEERISAIREIATAAGIHLVINARTDVYLAEGVAPEGRLRMAIERANAYRSAGADCVFVPDVGDLDKETIAALVREIAAPVNVIAGAKTPPIAELQAIGVARVSFGPRPMRALLSLLREIARELKTTGTYRRMSESTLTYREVNTWFEGARSPHSRRVDPA